MIPFDDFLKEYNELLMIKNRGDLIMLKRTDASFFKRTANGVISTKTIKEVKITTPKEVSESKNFINDIPFFLAWI